MTRLEIRHAFMGAIIGAKLLLANVKSLRRAVFKVSGAARSPSPPKWLKPGTPGRTKCLGLTSGGGAQRTARPTLRVEKLLAPVCKLCQKKPQVCKWERST